MKKIFSLAACISIALMGTAQVDRSKAPSPGPAPVIKIDDPATFKLPNGITVIVVENHKLPKVSTNINIDRGPTVEGKKAGVMEIMGSMLAEGTKTMNKEKFDEKIDLMGADLDLNSGGGVLSSLTRYFPEAFGIMADALRNPAFPQESFDKIKSQAITGFKTSEKSASAISARMVQALNYGKTTAMGEFETEQTLNSITLADVKKAYSDYVTPSRMYITLVGDITPADAKALVTKYFGNWKGRALKYPAFPLVKNPGKTEINLIDVPTAVQTEITVGNLISNPMSNPDYHALAIANQILGGGSDGKLFMNLREKHAFTYGSYSRAGSGRQQALFGASAQVRNEKADSAVAEIFAEINNLRNGNITPEELATAKAKYNGSFALGMENPLTTASYASNILINGLPKDFYRTFLTKINAVTIADVKRVAQKYFSTGNSRVIMVGKADVIAPKIARLGYAIKNFDKYASPVVAAPKTAPAMPPAATTNVTAQKVIDNYINAIGGKEALEKVKTMSSNLSMEMMGQTISGFMKDMAPNKSLVEMKMGPMTVFKQVFDGTTGYQQQMGKKKEMEADEITEKLKDDKGLFSQLFYNTAGFKTELKGTEKVNGEDAYKLIVTKPSGKVQTEYYSVKSGLMIKMETEEEAQGQTLTQEITFSDYQKVAGVSVPAKIVRSVMGQEMPMTLSDIKINEGVTEADFK